MGAEGKAARPPDFAGPREFVPVEGNANPIADWAIRVPLVHPQRDVVLFGCTEDVTCACDDGKKTHEKEQTQQPWYCRKLCARCQVPVCHDCNRGLHEFRDKGETYTRGTIPMALANDNYYGYIASLLVTKQVTWLELSLIHI